MQHSLQETAIPESNDHVHLRIVPLGRTVEDEAFSERECLIRFTIQGRDKGEARFWTCDLTEGYVRINGSYRT